MKNKVFMFLIVFSLIVGFLGSVYALNYDQTTSARIVPTVLKVSGDLSLSNSCSGGCYIKIFVNNNSVVQTIAQTEADLKTQLADGIYTNVFGKDTTGTNKKVPVKVSVYTGSTELISTTTDIPNPNFNMGPLTADNFSASNSPATGNLLSYNGTALSWIPFLAQTSNIADSAITTAKLADDSVSVNKLNILTYYSDNGTDPAYEHCPNNGASLIWDETPDPDTLIWSSSHKCGLDSVNLSLKDPLPQGMNELVGVDTSPSEAKTFGTCTWYLDGSTNFDYSYFNSSEKCAGIIINTDNLSQTLHTVKIVLTFDGVTKEDTNTFTITNDNTVPK